MKTYTREEVEAATKEYFDGDELATDVFFKYCLQNDKGEYLELTPADTHRRMAKEFARMENKFGGTSKLSENDVYQLFDRFRYICPQGSVMYGCGNDYSKVALSNCCVLDPPKDDLVSIFNCGRDMALAFAARFGVGIDLSKLRPTGMRVANASKTTTGSWSFAEYYSDIVRLIGQNNRVGAGICTLAVRHLDIERFVTCKQNKTHATGINISVRVDREFMEAVRDDKDYQLRFPIDSDNPVATKTIKAKQLWKLITDSATNFGEPGILFLDNIENYTPAESYSALKSTSCNPCGEQVLENKGNCRLVLLNLTNYVSDSFTSKATFDILSFADHVTKAVRLGDDLVELELEKFDNLIEKADTQEAKELWKGFKEASTRSRRIGLGTTGLADCLAKLRLRYGSKEAIKKTKEIFETLRNAAYRSSIELARERGPFPLFDWRLEKDNGYIQRLPEDIREDLSKYGRRHAVLLTQSPAGSMSTMMFTSSGLEPVYRNKYTRRRKLTEEEQKTGKVDFVDETGDKFQHYEVFHHNVLEYLNKFGVTVEDLPDYFVTADEIPWQERIDTQAAIQYYVDNSISSTINLPRGTSSDIVSEIYFDAWRKKIKGLTVYVDGSRDGVLITDVSFRKSKRPDRLSCDVHHTTIKGEKWIVVIGKKENQPYELFAGLANKVQIPKKYKNGTVIKHIRKTTRSLYDLTVGEGDDMLVIKDMLNVFDNPTHGSFTRMLSLLLRNGTPVSDICEQLLKDEKDGDLFSFSKVVSRVLKTYIKDGTKSGSKCPDCNSDLIYSEGCLRCSSCSYGKCG